MFAFGLSGRVRRGWEMGFGLAEVRLVLFDLSVVKFITQRTAFVGKTKKLPQMQNST